VDQTIQGCQSPRASITTKIVSSIPTPIPVAFMSTCAGVGMETLSAIGINLLWYTDSVAGIGNSLSPVVDLSIPQTVTYFISQSQNGCESNRAALKVAVAQNPTPTVSPSKWCASRAFKLVTASGTNLLWYTSSVGGTGTGINPSIDISQAANYQYYVSQMNGTCESKRVLASVEIVDSAVVSTAIVLPKCLGDTLKLTQTAPGSSLWQGPSGFTSNSNNTIRILNDNSLAGNYSLTVTNSGGCTATANFMVSTVPSVPTIALGDITICKGKSLSINPNTSQIGYWLYPGGTISGNAIGYATTTYSLSGVYTFIRQSGACIKKQAIQVSIVNCPPIA
ncbi:MAG: hypothetical protein K2Q22_08130, partial [Cytophagales bacterium]|nr:hypothetical protein [Cytophagales bacterium]